MNRLSIIVCQRYFTELQSKFRDKVVVQSFSNCDYVAEHQR